MAKKLWGRGIMTEAVVPVISYAFEELGFEELIFSNALGNIGSRKIKEKTGAIFSHIEKREFVDPNLKEREIWKLSKQDWNKLKN